MKKRKTRQGNGVDRLEVQFVQVVLERRITDLSTMMRATGRRFFRIEM